MIFECIVYNILSCSVSQHFLTKPNHHYYVPFSMAIVMWNSCTSVFPNTCANEHQEINKTKKQKKASRRVNMERSKVHGYKRKNSKRNSYSSCLQSPRVSYSRKQWRNYLTYTLRPSTIAAPWRETYDRTFNTMSRVFLKLWNI